MPGDIALSDVSPVPTPEGERERDGRWRGTPKEGGECGIHTMPLKESMPDEIRLVRGP